MVPPKDVARMRRLESGVKRSELDPVPSDGGKEEERSVENDFCRRGVR